MKNTKEAFHKSAQDTNQVVKKQKIDIPSYFQSKKPTLNEEVTRLFVEDRLSFNQISTCRGIRRSFKALGYDIPKSHQGVRACLFRLYMKCPKQKSSKINEKIKMELDCLSL